MDVTQKLVKLFSVDKQLRGLQTRLKAAEKFLAEQERQLTILGTKKTELDTQIRQFAVGAKNHEGEIGRLDAKMNTLREQMNSAQTNKEYKALLTEVNTIKAERDRLEQAAIEYMTKSDQLKDDLKKVVAELAERERVRGVAQDEKVKRAEEIKDRVGELQVQRGAFAADVPKTTLTLFERLVETRGDEAMATIEIIDRKRHEFSCGACQMGLPVDSVSGLLVSGKLTQCVSCGCILFIDEEVAKAMQPATSKR